MIPLRQVLRGLRPMARPVRGRILVSVLIGVVRIAATAWESYTTVRTANGMRQDTFARVLQSSWTGIESYRSGDAVNRLEEDVRVVTELLCARVPSVLVTVVQLLAASAYLMLMAPNLLWVLIILMVAAVVG